ncbi:MULTISPECIES: hypothetical protein [Pseudomonas]|uniref:hypothetical protein n=1 Tax=unclassified Pseudomonas TaxID=196821 RepID=UPI0015A114ED|nr:MULTISPECIES: hypothetical protein [unclassified Pseudomonas]NVZ16692.1 hypothetical protein [Pseudomonas sp. IPO3775]NWA78094.1 hypothetical protein [Pseudomonas sp. C8002]
MELSHFCNYVTPQGDNTWTLATRLANMLYKAEQLYGPRDLSWTVVGVEFGTDIPSIWFPQPGKNVAIRLTTSALDSKETAYYELAHECIHLLSPAGRVVVPVIEEGLATVFSEDYYEEVFQQKATTRMPSYAKAAALVRDLLSIAPDAILRIRSVQPAFTLITEKTFLDAGLSVPRALIDELLLPFQRV